MQSYADYVFGTICTVPMAYEEMKACEALYVAYEFKEGPFFSSRHFWGKMAYNLKSAYGLYAALNPALRSLHSVNSLQLSVCQQ